MNTNLVDQLAAEIAVYEARFASLKQAHAVLINGQPAPVAVYAPSRSSRKYFLP